MYCSSTAPNARLDRFPTLTPEGLTDAPTKAQADAEARIAAVVAERDAAIAQGQADADAKVRAAEADRDEARKTAAEAKAAAVEARQDIARAEAAAQAAQAETERVRADAGRMLGEARADAAREREELRADLRARAERAERQADTYRDELAQLRAVSSDPVAADAPPKPARRGTRAQSAQARTAADQ